MLAAVFASGCGSQSPNTNKSIEYGQTNEDAVAKSNRGSPHADLTRNLTESNAVSSHKPDLPGPLADPPESPDEAGKQKDDDNSLALDDHYRELIVGIWQDEYQGKRTITVREDGTATMVVEPEGFAARLYADRMTFVEEWRIEEGRLQLHAIGGEPQGRVNLVLKAMGDTSHYRILELTEDRMRLADANGETTYDWRRSKMANDDSQ